MSNQQIEQLENWIAEATIRELHENMKNGEWSAEQITLVYLQKITERNEKINAVLEINPDSVQIARALDIERKSTGMRSLLHGIPVLLKDNIDTGDRMHTSCGSLALQDYYAESDAFLVKKLRDAGAVILGKTNMTEWANFMSDKMTNGWSSRGSQVHNPYGAFDVGGSSSGAAAAIASNLAMVSIGTETSGSIINPAAQNSIVGIKPTIGAISRAGVIPLSFTQDTPGPMARTVEDAAIAFFAMIGVDSRDPTTAIAVHYEAMDLDSLFNKKSLEGVRMGVARNIFEGEASTEQVTLFNQVLEKLTGAGAIIVDPIDLTVIENDLNYEVLIYEFKVAINDYLGKTRESNRIRTLKDVINFNNEHPNETLKFGQNLLEKADRTSGTLTEPQYLEALLQNDCIAKQTALGKAFEEHEIQALVFPQDIGCSFGAAAGYPSVTVPAGYTEKGEPFAITFSGRAYSEKQLIQYAYAFEQTVKARRQPSFEKGLH